MRPATTLSEWQLQAVLHKAKLTQYFETFISQGGDDIDQIMQCDENEFLEIMSLVGMASKPLHVRRLQRTLVEFSQNRAQFLLNSIPFVGLPPPMLEFGCSTSTTGGAISSSTSTEGLIAALQFLIPGFLPPTDNIADQLSMSARSTKPQQSELLFAGPGFTAIAQSSTYSPVPPINTSSASNSAFSLVSNNLGKLMGSPLTAKSETMGTASTAASMMPMLSSDAFLSCLAATIASNCNSDSSQANAIQTHIVAPPLLPGSATAGTPPQQQMSQFPFSSAVSDSIITNKRIKLSCSPPISSASAPGCLGGNVQQQNPLAFQQSPPFIDAPFVVNNFNSIAAHFGTNSNCSSSAPILSSSGPTNNYHQIESSVQQQTPLLSENDVAKIKEFAEQVVERVPRMEPRLVQNKKRVSRDLLEAMALPSDTEGRVEVFRHYAQIYGRFDAKRRPDKALTQHERIINEAAVQVALLRPELLTRRDELFPLARKVARLAGFPSATSRPLSSSTLAGNDGSNCVFADGKLQLGEQQQDGSQNSYHQGSGGTSAESSSNESGGEEHSMNEQLNSPNSFRSSFSECSQVLSVADESSANNYHQHQDNIIDIEQRPEKEHQELEVTGTSTEEQEEPSDKDESNPGSVNNKILISKRVIRTRQSSRMCLNASEEGQ